MTRDARPVLTKSPVYPVPDFKSCNPAILQSCNFHLANFLRMRF